MTYRVAVRALCEFTAKRGDLDLRFTPSPTAQEGIAGHALVAARRGDGYQREVPLAGAFGPLQVRGRADGYDPVGNRLEEVKTHRGDLARQPDNHRHLHWAQVRVYGWLLCAERGLDEVELALVYLDVASQKETTFTTRASAAELRAFFEAQCQAFLAWAEQELAHQARRDGALQALRFPHASFRLGQRELAEAVYKAASTGCCLMAQAPTGIGKTLATLFPQLKALGGGRLERLFFLAAKTPGRQLALHSLATLRDSVDALPVRVLELTARDKACEHPGSACHGDACPLARGFYDRLPAAREAAAERRWLDRAALREVALAHNVCPYYLGQEMARWSDVVVGDYNYYFDLGALLFGLAQLNQWQVGVLVDEAHNLVERARAMYSAELRQGALKALVRSVPGPLKKPLERVQRSWSELNKAQRVDYQAYDEPPQKLLGALQNAVTAITDHLAEQPGAPLDPALMTFYFDALHFTRMAELFDTHSLFDLNAYGSGRNRQSTLCLRNLVPAPFIGPRLEASRSTVLFSATLNPRRYYSDLLGVPGNTPWLEVQSPFTAEQLQVRVAQGLSTRYQHRAQSLEPIVELMADQFYQRPGHYLAFFSSYQYLEQVATLFAERHPFIPAWSQSRSMGEAERLAFLERFTEGGRGIGFAVLGGAFGEGIDLPGERLIGAFIATLGLPQVNPVNEQLKQRMGAIFQAGYDYTYLYPGLQKVVQAAGRVIRTQGDRGVVHLMDERFAQPEIRRLLPSWWRVETHDATDTGQREGSACGG
ncbi:ATP-dependent DNA helicase [Pseudomonas otitidis]|uniref:ATP-dependent DNA helicase n=1 Tax=Metapseudomonas otitidis TaxID=319939 RepID=UPI0024AE0592|nr:ATP-dependent DNA helicase [Pseudomonas otitidis]MDI6528670.1 ATP-dependent DNA helicase [Pseudomonas otitidis]